MKTTIQFIAIAVSTAAILLLGIHAAQAMQAFGLGASAVTAGTATMLVASFR